MNWQTIHTQSYYRLEEDGGNIADLSAPLIVNCSGALAYDAPFTGHMPAGRHDFYLMYVAQGQMKARADEASFALTAGDAIIYTPERPYAYSRAGEGRVVYLWVHFTGSEAQHVLDRRGLRTATVYHVDCADEIAADFEAIWRLFIARPLLYLEEAAARLDLLLTHVGRFAAQTAHEQPRARIWASLNYMNGHYMEHLTMETLSAMEYLSVSRYAALFRRALGRSPQRYLIELRLRNAQELLMRTDMSISEVARSVGYDDALYFSRLFRKYMGFSPREARRDRQSGLFDS